MELLVNSKQKRVLQKQIAKSRKSVSIISSISKFLLIVGLVGGILYLVINFVSPTLSMVEINGVPEKDTSFIIITSSFIFAPCLIFSACLNVLAKNLAGGNSTERVDETLMLTENVIRYSYRVKYQSASSERRVITMDYTSIKKVDYENQTGALTFIGKFTSDYYDNYKKKKPAETEKIEDFVIYDYFLPSLKETLLSKGVKVSN